ncbi:MAG: addiction module toxin RelE [Betaproteobacteria bacterium CG2_30_59_46]|nr:MAG: addiction module toxin RelE [Betaproteobacteria bacterium CG2_30_59_46]PIQ12371.1 MAG: addiction module toxin RelE [Hydrogenophilales bacterium CG18_big_fil_WC_8_21_14_2_50_58_12]PIY01731.1 MAG: addiction module toxin RelE [Hydrogenophilales bacterium CG_4_10_14_3_um_filter_58_23]PJB05242.1 MAG: addiction module toxin RelE [Hydrogenophilales bacterium CG_4_9_14_3_um_filter_59_35]
MKVLDTPTFNKVVKKLFATEKKTVDEAIRKIADDPTLGEEKKGDLAGIFVFKFKMNKQDILLSYGLLPSKEQPQELVLLSLGSHENFYSNLKRQIG